MKNPFQIPYAIYILLLLLPATIMGAEWERQRDALLKQAEEEFNNVLMKKAPPEIIARDNGLPWPVKPPAKNKLIVRTETQTIAQKLADVEFSKEFVDSEIQRIKEQYSLFKIDDIITVETKLRQAEIVTGKLNAFNRDFAKIGNRIINMSDFPDYVRDRFFVASCNQLQERKVVDLKRRIQAQKARFIDDKFMELLPNALLENGYYPLDDNQTSKAYTTLENWISVQDMLEKKLEKVREDMADVHEEIVSGIMKKNGFVYNAIQAQWFPARQPAVQDGGEAASQNPQEKKGVFQKLKGIFGK